MEARPSAPHVIRVPCSGPALSAAVDGGGVYQDAGTISKSFTIVRANTPNDCGPGNTIPQCEG